MATQLTVQQAISWLNGTGDENTILTIKEMGILNYLENLQASTFRSIRAPQSGSLQNGGTLIWRLPRMIPVGAYSISQNVSNVSKWDVITSNEIERRSGSFTNEYFDVSMVAPEQAVASVNMIVNSLSLSAAADFNAHFWMRVKEYFDKHPEQTLYLPNLSAKKVLSEDESREINAQLAHKRNDLTKIYNNKAYGVNPNEYFTIINGAGAINIAQLLTRLNNSVQSFEVTKAMLDPSSSNGVVDPANIVNGRIVVDNMVGISIAENVAWNEDYIYDMTGYNGFILHKDFIAYPTLEPSFGVRQVPNNLNFNYIVEYAMTYAFLRPQLGCAIVDSFKAGSTNGEYKVSVNKQLVLNSNKLFEDDKTTYASSDAAKVKIEGNKAIGVAVGKATITATNGKDTFTFDIECIA